jgi:hypothetical protein
MMPKAVDWSLEDLQTLWEMHQIQRTDQKMLVFFIYTTDCNTVVLD